MSKKSKTAQAIKSVWNWVHIGDGPKAIEFTARELSTVLHIVTAHQSGRRPQADYTEREEAILSASRTKLSAAMMAWWDQYEGANTNTISTTFTATAKIQVPMPAEGKSEVQK